MKAQAIIKASSPTRYSRANSVISGKSDQGLHYLPLNHCLIHTSSCIFYSFKILSMMRTFGTQILTLILALFFCSENAVCFVFLLHIFKLNSD